MAVMKTHTSTLPLTQLGTARSTWTHCTSILQSMHGRHMRPPLPGTVEKGRRKGKESEAGLISMSPDTQVKEQVSVTSFLKMKWRKYWRSVDNKQPRHVSVQPADRGEGDEKARLSGVSNLFKFEISAKQALSWTGAPPKRKRAEEN